MFKYIVVDSIKPNGIGTNEQVFDVPECDVKFFELQVKISGLIIYCRSTLN